MGAEIAEVLPGAVALALVNPISIVAIIVLHFSPRARSAAPAFLGGWVIGLSAVLALLLFVFPIENLVGSEREPSTLASAARLLLGLALLVLAFRRWQSRSALSEEKDLPPWMARLKAASPLTAFGIGAILSGINPKNLAFTLSAAISIAQAELTVREQMIPFVLFVLLSSIGVAMPVIWWIIAPDTAAKKLAEAKSWLTANYATIMAAVFLLFGVKLFSQGLGGFTS